MPLKFYGAIQNTQDYKEIVKKSFPRYNNYQLKKQISNLLKKYPNGFQPQRITDFLHLQRVFKLPKLTVKEGKNFVIRKNYSYELNPKLGKLFVQKNLSQSLKLLNSNTAKRELPKVRKNHFNMLMRLGINRQQILFTKTNFLKDEEVISTYGHRVFDGMIVDGSYLKLESKNRKFISRVDLIWPNIFFHSKLKIPRLRPKKDVFNSILNKVITLTKTNSFENIELKMDIVLRPVFYKEKQVFIPVIKVSPVDKKSQRDLSFYEDILLNKISYRTKK